MENGKLKMENLTAEPKITYTLISNDGDVWNYKTLDEAEKTQYIFGGTITAKLVEQ